MSGFILAGYCYAGRIRFAADLHLCAPPSSAVSPAHILAKGIVGESVRITKPEIARAILAQRTGEISRRDEPGISPTGQGACGF